MPRYEHAAPCRAFVFGRELRRALGHQRVLLADEDVALLADVDDDLAPGTEGIGQDPLVAHRHRHLAGAVADAEVRHRALALVPRHDLAGQLVGLARLGPRSSELARAARLARGAEARVDERAREQHGGAERHDESDRALSCGIHRPRLWRGRYPNGVETRRTRTSTRIRPSDPQLDEWTVPRARDHIKVCNEPVEKPSSQPPVLRRKRPCTSPPHSPHSSVATAATATPCRARTPSCQTLARAKRSGGPEDIALYSCTAATPSRRRSRPRSAARTAARARPGSRSAGQAHPLPRGGQPRDHEPRHGQGGDHLDRRAARAAP